jgi:uncharacterized protein (DUF1501 family)
MRSFESTRRDLLRAAAAAGVLAPVAGVRELAFAADSEDTRSGVLVVLFLRGGCDSLNLVAPVNDRDYVAARIDPLRVLDAGDKVGIPLANGLGRKVDFRFHAHAGPLAELYVGGRLAVVHAVGLSNETRSHFVAQELIERGVVGDSAEDSAGAATAAGATQTGWLARYAALAGFARLGAERIPALSASNGLDAMLDGFSDSLAVPDLANGVALPGGPVGEAVLTELYRSGTDDIAASGRRALARFRSINARLPKGLDGKILPYRPNGEATYDESGESAGRGLEAIARLIKMDVGLRVACADMGGWDTHEGQPGRFDRLVTQLSQNLQAFWNDLAPHHDRLTVVTISEFGRRLRSNKSNGTDHGHGGAMLVLGGKVNGGRMYGEWPGLSTPALDRAVDLAVTTDYRSVLWSIVRPTLAEIDLAALFPGLTMARELPLMSA